MSNDSESFPTISDFEKRDVLMPMAPGSKMHNLAGRTEELKARLAAGTHQYYVFGRITYTDAFNVPRQTLFRLEREPGKHRLIASCEGNTAS